MTKIQILILFMVSLCFSCKNKATRNIEHTIPDHFSTSEKKELKIKPERINKENIRKKVKVTSVEEALIMPSDYLTTAMTVETDRNEQLVFLDMDGFEKLTGKEITIEYKLVTGSKLLLCFDCSSYTKEIELHDITSFHSKIEYQELKLKKYTEDEWIIPNSTFEMLDKNGTTKTFTTNNNDMILDSLKMKSSFYTYGITKKIHPKLMNRDELEKLIK